MTVTKAAGKHPTFLPVINMPFLVLNLHHSMYRVHTMRIGEKCLCSAYHLRMRGKNEIQYQTNPRERFALKCPCTNWNRYMQLN